MPIKGLSDIRRFSRGGKIRLGEKRKSKSGAEYPAKLDYFLFDPEDKSMLPELHGLYGQKPDKLTVCFASEDAEVVFPQHYKCYGASGLQCKGDGDTATRVAEHGEYVECDCPTPANCDFAIDRGKGGRPGCKPVASLQFFLKDFGNLFVWQIDTSSFHSIVNVNSGLTLLRSIAGRISFIPITLKLKPKTIQPDGKKQTAYVLDLIIPVGLNQVNALQPLITSGTQVKVPALLEHDAPDDLYPASQIDPVVDEDGVVQEPAENEPERVTTPVTEVKATIEQPEQEKPVQAKSETKPVAKKHTGSLANHPDVLALKNKVSNFAFRTMLNQASKESWDTEQLVTALTGRIKNDEESPI